MAEGAPWASTKDKQPALVSIGGLPALRQQDRCTGTARRALLLLVAGRRNTFGQSVVFSVEKAW
jgi:hypothetical protein